MRIQFRNISQGQYLNINTFNLKDIKQKKLKKKINYDIEHTFSYKSKNPKKKKNTICNIVILLLDLTLCKYIIQII